MGNGNMANTLRLLGLGAALGTASLLPGCVAAQTVETVAAAPAPASTVGADGFATEDALFAQPYVDVQEWRDSPVRHFYVHGGFTGTDTRFSYYFPPAEQYDGRFFQHVTPVPDNENLAQGVPAGPFNNIGFAAASGAYFVETNGGGSIDLTRGSQALADPTITAFRANAAAAQFSRHVAQQVYPGAQRPFGYIYGGSGGAYRTIGSLERTQGVWDGGVPYVNGSTMAIPNTFTVRMQALRVLHERFPQIVDAMEPGGSGDPYAGLSDYDASVLREAERMGFPMETWFGYRTMGLHGFAALYGGILLADPTYFTQFWTEPGYLGHDRPDLFAEARVQHGSVVTGLVTGSEAERLGIIVNRAGQAERGGVDTAFLSQDGSAAEPVVGVRLADAPPATYFLGGELRVESGQLANQRLFLDSIHGDVVIFGVVNPAQVAQLAVGDRVQIDNSNFLAMETYHRHQVPGADFPVWDQFRNAAGEPLYPQRPFLVGPLFTQNTAGSLLTGDVGEKVVLVASLWDREAMPWQADWYRQRVAAHGGPDAVRLYYTKHAMHGDQPAVEDASRVVSYLGELQEALRVLAAWVEQGAAPPASTSYRIADGQVLVPDNAADRLGLQPTVSLTVNGGERADVRVGDVVRLEGTIAAARPGDRIVAAAWDFAGAGNYETATGLQAESGGTSVAASHSFSQPGTYFVTLNATAQPAAAVGTPYSRLTNLARVRVVVSD